MLLGSSPLSSEVFDSQTTWRLVSSSEATFDRQTVPSAPLKSFSVVSDLTQLPSTVSGGFSFSKTKSSSISSGVNGDLERELGVRERFLDFFKDSPLSIERERDLERDCERVLDLDLCFRFLCFFLSLDLCFLCLCFLERFSFETSPLLLSAFLEESRSSSFPTLPSISPMGQVIL